MKVIITRHGQTDENIKKIDIGHDSKALLNKEGIKQAQKLADYLKNETIMFAYVSPQERAVHTAIEVLKFHPRARVIHTPHLKEQNLGIYESAPKQVFKEVKAKSLDPFHLFKPEGGESYIELQKRVKTFFNTLIEKHEHDTVLMVSHGGTLGMLYLHLFAKPITKENYKNHKPENTAFTILEVFKNAPIKIHKINSVEHLKKYV